MTWERTTPGLADVDPAYLEPSDPEPAVGDAWLGGPEPDDDSELAATDPAGFEPAPGDAWLDGFEPAAADAWPADPGLEDAVPADTWFTGVGPADQRFADAGPADVEPAGEPSATGGAGPYFADSGVAPASDPSFRLVTTPGRPGARSGPAQPGAGIRRTGSRGRHGPRAAGGCRWARRSRSIRRRRSPLT